MQFWWSPQFVVINHPPLEDAELAAQFAYAENDKRFVALMQVIGELERNAIQTAQETVGNPPVSASYNGGAEHLDILRNRILALRLQAFGKIDKTT